ncbi:TraI/MobA(P) family conjugative relaxase [Xanthomonas perforans]|uniref:TraI/MobA(P) family conjugative relaxase n=1 Tax=Xanthomonas perforans TaxID=442694 RepID=UPI003B67F464
MLAPVSKMGGKGGKSNFKRLHAYLKEEVTKETGEVIQRGEMVYSDNIMSPETAAAEMRAVAAENKRVGDPVYHYQLAWQEGEKPTREQWEAAAKKSVDALGFKDHQYVIAAHSDTDHFHVHVMVNRVNPETYRAHYPEFSHKTLDRTCREIEQEQGWKESPGLYRVDPVTKQIRELTPEEKALQQRKQEGKLTQQRAAKLEQYGDVESLKTYAKGEPARDLNATLRREGATWQDVHATLGKHGLVLEQGEKGGYTVRAANGETRVKASDAFRNHFSGKDSREKLAAKLGEYQPPERFIAARKPEQEYAPRPAERTGRQRQRDQDPQQRQKWRDDRANDRRLLRQRFDQYRTDAYKGAAGSRHTSARRFQDLNRQFADRRQMLRAQGLPGFARKVASGVLTVEKKLAERKLRKELAEIRKQHKPLNYRAWVMEEARRGDAAAMQQVRGWAYREKDSEARRVLNEQDATPHMRPAMSNEGRMMTPKEFAEKNGMDWRVNKHGDMEVHRREANGKTVHAFTDEGDQVRMNSRDPRDVAKAMEYAVQKAGGNAATAALNAARKGADKGLEALGSLSFEVVGGTPQDRKAIAEWAAKNNVPAKAFKDMAMRELVNRQQRELIAKNSRAIGGRDLGLER